MGEEYDGADLDRHEAEAAARKASDAYGAGAAVGEIFNKQAEKIVLLKAKLFFLSHAMFTSQAGRELNSEEVLTNISKLFDELEDKVSSQEVICAGAEKYETIEAYRKREAQSRPERVRTTDAPVLEAFKLAEEAFKE